MEILPQHFLFSNIAVPPDENALEEMLIVPGHMIPTENPHTIHPAISPTAFENPRADSAYADAHCAIASSDAPEQTIITMTTRNMGQESMRK